MCCCCWTRFQQQGVKTPPWKKLLRNAEQMFFFLGAELPAGHTHTFVSNHSLSDSYAECFLLENLKVRLRQQANVRMLWKTEEVISISCSFSSGCWSSSSYVPSSTVPLFSLPAHSTLSSPLLHISLPCFLLLSSFFFFFSSSSSSFCFCSTPPVLKNP